jgi:hypothetical protein
VGDIAPVSVLGLDGYPYGSISEDGKPLVSFVYVTGTLAAQIQSAIENAVEVRRILSMIDLSARSPSGHRGRLQRHFAEGKKTCGARFDGLEPPTNVEPHGGERAASDPRWPLALNKKPLRTIPVDARRGTYASFGRALRRPFGLAPFITRHGEVMFNLPQPGVSIIRAAPHHRAAFCARWQTPTT